MYNRVLKIMRQYNRLTQTELAEKLSLSKSYICELEQEAGKKPSLETLEKYADYFNIKLSSLLIFAEMVEGKDNNLAQKCNYIVADKIIFMLEWLERTTRDENED